MFHHFSLECFFSFGAKHLLLKKDIKYDQVAHTLQLHLFIEVQRGL
jgi:hypothetical protein